MDAFPILAGALCATAVVAAVMASLVDMASSWPVLPASAEPPCSEALRGGRCIAWPAGVRSRGG
ncbi:MAG TPA: hypothetical protein DDZ67_13720 [Xanthomonadaceae bacterium]|nr:hypothetical protein [Xanthomonadaceae bacterium]